MKKIRKKNEAMESEYKIISTLFKLDGSGLKDCHKGIEFMTLEEQKKLGDSTIKNISF